MQNLQPHERVKAGRRVTPLPARGTHPESPLPFCKPCFPLPVRKMIPTPQSYRHLTCGSSHPNVHLSASIFKLEKMSRFVQNKNLKTLTTLSRSCSQCRTLFIRLRSYETTNQELNNQINQLNQCLLQTLTLSQELGKINSDGLSKYVNNLEAWIFANAVANAHESPQCRQHLLLTLQRMHIPRVTYNL